MPILYKLNRKIVTVEKKLILQVIVPNNSWTFYSPALDGNSFFPWIDPTSKKSTEQFVMVKSSRVKNFDPVVIEFELPDKYDDRIELNVIAGSSNSLQANFFGGREPNNSPDNPPPPSKKTFSPLYITVNENADDESD